MTALLARLRLSIAELDVIGRSAGLSCFPGLPAGTADATTDGVVVDGLRARGIIEPVGGDGFGVEEDAAGLLGVVLGARVSLDISVDGDAGPLVAVVHVQEQACVLQHIDTGLVTLAAVLPDQLPTLVRRLCDPAPGAVVEAPDPALMSRAELVALESRTPEPEDLRDYVRSAGAPRRFGRAAARHPFTGASRGALAWVDGPGGIWTVRGPEARITLQQLDADGLVEAMLALAA